MRLKDYNEFFSCGFGIPKNVVNCLAVYLGHKKITTKNTSFWDYINIFHNVFVNGVDDYEFLLFIYKNMNKFNISREEIIGYFHFKESVVDSMLTHGEETRLIKNKDERCSMRSIEGRGTWRIK